MRRLAPRDKRALIDAASAELGQDRRHIRSWRGYMDTLDFYEDSTGEVIAIRAPQVMKTVYVPPGPHAPTDDEEARRYWIEDNLRHARASLPSQGHMVLREFRDRRGRILFEELVPCPAHLSESVHVPDESKSGEFQEAVDALYRKFASKLSRAWDRYGTLVLTAS